jgi:hypothetical protein
VILCEVERTLLFNSDYRATYKIFNDRIKLSSNDNYMILFLYIILKSSSFIGFNLKTNLNSLKISRHNQKNR